MDDKTILVVDDDNLVRVLVKRMLGEHGYRVVEAASGADALQVLREGTVSIDLLLTDMRMPKMHGTELARTVRAMMPWIPVMFMSGFSEELDLVEGADYIQKPFNKNSLLAKVQKAVSPPAKDRMSGGPPARSVAVRPVMVSLPVDETVSKLIRAEWEMARKKL